MEVNEEQAEISLVGRMLIELVSRGKRHAQDPYRILGTIAEPTGTDGRPVISKLISVTGRLIRPLLLFFPARNFTFIFMNSCSDFQSAIPR